jgi:6-phosphogluconolactonase
VTFTLPLEVAADPMTAARRVGAIVAAHARVAAGDRGGFSMALSKAPRAMLEAIVTDEPPWDAVDVFQVDERVAAAGEPARNLTLLLEELPRGRVHPMPVEDPDLDEAARRYAQKLPFPLDLVHLGLGADGHTASLLPGDPVLDVRDEFVSITGEYEGHRRMTLTYPALDAAREIVWLVTGESKREVLARLLAGDTSIPAGRVANPHQLVVADEAAAGPGVT